MTLSVDESMPPMPSVTDERQRVSAQLDPATVVWMVEHMPRAGGGGGDRPPDDGLTLKAALLLLAATAGAAAPADRQQRGRHCRAEVQVDTHERSDGHAVALRRLDEIERYQAAASEERVEFRRMMRALERNVDAICHATGASCGE